MLTHCVPERFPRLCQAIFTVHTVVRGCIEIGFKLAYCCVTMTYYIFRVISHRKLKSFMTGLSMGNKLFFLYRRYIVDWHSCGSLYRRYRRLAHNELRLRNTFVLTREVTVKKFEINFSQCIEMPKQW